LWNEIWSRPTFPPPLRLVSPPHVGCNHTWMRSLNRPPSKSQTREGRFGCYSAEKGCPVASCDTMTCCGRQVKGGSCLIAREQTPMAVRPPKDTWFVSFEQKRMRPAKRSFSRTTETFRSELDAKKFAKQKLTETENVSAGTLNPHLPKRVISSAQMIQWLEESTGTAPAP
jgi:hypothetical protein